MDCCVADVEKRQAVHGAYARLNVNAGKLCNRLVTKAIRSATVWCSGKWNLQLKAVATDGAAIRGGMMYWSDLYQAIESLQNLVELLLQRN